MSLLKWIVLALAFIQGSWFSFDGARALIVGDYVTPTSGAHAGRLGPWSKIVSAAGLDPRGVVVKSLHLALGIAWLFSLICFILLPTAGWWMLLVCAVGSLWYLPVGTNVSVVEIVLLLQPQIRSSM